jgi:putative heme-binding domain-containing protein
MRSLFFCVLALLVSGLIAAQKPPLKLGTDDVVVFLGGTDMVRAQKSGHLETLLTWKFSKAKPRFRDLSWEADTVFALGTETERWRRDGFRGIKGLGNLETQLEKIGATVIIVQLGKNEAFAGRKGVEKFKAACDRLLQRLKGKDRRLVVLSPTPFEKSVNPLLPDLSPRNADLRFYVEALSQQAARHDARFVDLFSKAPALTQNGLHVTPDNQAALAQRIATGLGISRPQGFASLDDLQAAVREKHRLWREYWRPSNWKCLFGDDNRRVFSIGRNKVPTIRDEWAQLPTLINKAEQQISVVAVGKAKPKLTPQPTFPARKAELDPMDEQKAFRPANGFAVNLFASEKLGVANPLSMRWDAKGRMYVACTWAYPQLRPGEIPNDKILQLTDTDGDGRADKSCVFADGLNIPTGMETGDGGVYVGQGEELLFLRDTNEDGRADERRVVLSGFGTGDTHQAINSFVWSPDGELFFCQGDGIESRVETPWGVSGLHQAGVLRLRPRTLRLAGLLDDNMGPGNPWGVVFDDWGQSVVVDGAGGISFLTPGTIPAKHRQRLDRIGQPGGYCGVEMLNGRHLPKAILGHFVLNDYKANSVRRFALKAEGSGYKLEWKEPLLKSSHRNFRPVDIKVGPDGALYIADFYNPIICHQDDYFRDPTRDFHHGRIWRLSVIDTPAVPLPRIVGAKTPELLEQLKSPERWTRQKAKNELAQRSAAKISFALNAWVKKLDHEDANHDRHLLEALAAVAMMESVQPQLLERVLRAKDHRARAFAARIAGRWQDRLQDAEPFLARAANDEHPQVRMEAILACGQSAWPSAIKLAAQAVTRHARDRWIDYAFTQAVFHHERHWRPALTQGRLDFGSDVRALSAVLQKRGPRDLLNTLMRLARSPDIDTAARHGIFNSIASIGDPNELRAIFNRDFHPNPASQAAAFVALQNAATSREVKPKDDLNEPLRAAIKSDNDELCIRALSLASVWKLTDLSADIRALAGGSKSQPVRIAAILTLGQLGRDDSLFSDLLNDAETAESLKLAALNSMSRIDMNAAANFGAKMVATGGNTSEVLVLFFSREGGSKVLAEALLKNDLKAGPAAKALAALQATGSSDETLTQVLSKAAGIAVAGPVYSENFVRDLARESVGGNAARGKEVFHSVGCVACHRVGAPTAGITHIGPELSTIGNTLSTERIIEEVLWPGRAVKEGFSLLQVTTKDGTIHQGYEERSRSEDIFLKPLGRADTVRIPQNQIRAKSQARSAMPAGLTATLKREQLRDLIRFLSWQGRE